MNVRLVEQPLSWSTIGELPHPTGGTCGGVRRPKCHYGVVIGLPPLRPGIGDLVSRLLADMLDGTSNSAPPQYGAG
jgi:hypothetical protein